MNTYVDFLVAALEGLSDADLFDVIMQVEDRFATAENNEIMDVNLDELRNCIDSEDWVPEAKDKSRAQKRRDDYLKTARRTKLQKDIMFYNPKNWRAVNGKLRDCMPDGHTERLRKGKKAEHKRQRCIDKRETALQMREMIEDYWLDVMFLQDFFDSEYGWDY